MRLQSIYLKEYRVIRDLLIEFEQEANIHGQENVLTAPSQQAYALNLIVGLNGVGKSTLLLALADLFRYLDMPPYFPPFGFEIRYLLASTEQKQTSIFISNLDQETQEIRQDRRLRFCTDRNPEILVDRVDTLSLPRLVVAFTTGSEQAWNLDTENRDSNSPTERPDQPPHPQAENLEKQLVEWYLRELSGKP